MSVVVSAAVWERSRSKGSALLLLLAIADHAHDDGDGAYPSYATLAKKIRMSERNTIRLVGTLVSAGEVVIRRHAGPKGCNVFRVTDQVMRGDNLSLRGDNQGNEGVTVVSPKPSVEPSEEPSLKPSLPQAAKTPRERDPIWDAMTVAIGYQPTTTPSRATFGKACKELKAVGATAEDIAIRARRYTQHWPGLDLTPSALVKHWDALAKDQPSINRNGGNHERRERHAEGGRSARIAPGPEYTVGYKRT